MKWYQRIFEFTLDYILPHRCIACREFVVSDSGFCAGCWGRLNFISKPYCLTCGWPFSFVVQENNSCAKCISKQPSCDQSRSLLRFDEYSKKIIYDFKYNDKTHYAKLFSKLLMHRYSEQIEKADIIAPVPMHRFKRLYRHYNQAQILACDIASLSKKTMIPDLLIKNKIGKSQVGLSKAQRQKNLAGTISVNPKYDIVQKNILLVDDVRTTGATTNLCGDILKKQGANIVNLVTIAHVV